MKLLIGNNNEVVKSSEPAASARTFSILCHTERPKGASRCTVIGKRKINTLFPVSATSRSLEHSRVHKMKSIFYIGDASGGKIRFPGMIRLE